MLRKDMKLIKEIVRQLSTCKEIVKVIAYGSRVRGDNRIDSDYDILIIVNHKDRSIKNKIIDIVYSYELEKDISISIKILSTHEFKTNESLGSPFIKSVNEEGITIYDAEQRRKKEPCPI